jgi:Ca2+-binding EF-hand superfamily protein
LLDPPRHDPFNRLGGKIHAVSSHWLYEIFGGLMIALNASVIAWEAQHAAELADLGHDGTTAYFQLLGLLFGLWFAVELALRVFVQGFLPLFFSEERWWNVIDVLVVLGFVLDLVLTVADVSSGLDLSLLRVIRLLRVVRVLRVLRSFKNMRDMRIMVSMLCSAVVPLIWISVILLSVCMTFAIFFTDAVADYIRVRSGSDDPDLAALRHYYGDLPRTVATLFMSITGGVDWEGVAQPLSVVSGWCVAAFYVFIAFSAFAMLNVISAIFIDTTIQRSKNDREFVIQTEMEGKRDFINTMDMLFVELDQDGDGEINLEELQQHMLLPKVEAYFKSLDLDVTQAKKLFGLMDLDHSGTISREEFIVGCSRLRGEARELNVAILQYEVRWIKNLVVNLGLHLDEHFSTLRGNLNDSLGTARGKTPRRQSSTLRR